MKKLVILGLWVALGGCGAEGAGGMPGDPNEPERDGGSPPSSRAVLQPVGDIACDEYTVQRQTRSGVTKEVRVWRGRIEVENPHALVFEGCHSVAYPTCPANHTCVGEAPERVHCALMLPSWDEQGRGVVECQREVWDGPDLVEKTGFAIVSAYEWRR